jgi:hypothetical protein
LLAGRVGAHHPLAPSNGPPAASHGVFVHVRSDDDSASTATARRFSLHRYLACRTECYDFCVCHTTPDRVAFMTTDAAHLVNYGPTAPSGPNPPGSGAKGSRKRSRHLFCTTTPHLPECHCVTLNTLWTSCCVREVREKGTTIGRSLPSRQGPGGGTPPRGQIRGKPLQRVVPVGRLWSEENGRHHALSTRRKPPSGDNFGVKWACFRKYPRNISYTHYPWSAAG